MSWRLKVPKIMHVYWGGNKPLSFMRYLTILSFSKYNPDWEIRCYTPTNPIKEEAWTGGEQKNHLYGGHDHLKDAAALENVSIIRKDFSDIGIPGALSEVHRSDLLRLYLLSEYGGLWSDMDILYINSMNNIFYNSVLSDKINIEHKVQENDVYVCYDVFKHYHSIGFLMARKEEDFSFFREVFKMGLSMQGSKEYQGYGRFLLEKYFRYTPDYTKKFKETHNIRVANISQQVVYHINSFAIKRLYSGPPLNLTASSIGIHWYAGSKISAVYDNVLNRDNVESFSSLPIYRYICDALK